MPKTPPTAFIVTESFALKGVTYSAGETVAAGHPVLRGRKALFRPFVPTHVFVEAEPEVTPAKAEPEVEVVETKAPTKAELLEQADAAGVEVSSSDTKAEIAEKLDEAQ